jgi:predicted aconitase
MAAMTILEASERRIAQGAGGAAMAMRIVAESARLLGASKLIPIASAHIDGCLYHGDSGTLFAETLVAGAARVQVPTTLNVGALDLLRASTVKLSGEKRAMARRLMTAYEALGCRPTWTCAPYQAGHRPAAGEDVAWGESNAVAFCNSVLGARTNRYGDFLDIACAISGRAPLFGLHVPANRRARVVVDVTGLSARLRDSDVLYPAFGSWYGKALGETIGVIDGLAAYASEDRLKAFGAAAAASGAVALFHVAGLTPEAADLAAALGGAPAEARIVVTPKLIRAARDGLSTAEGDRIDAVAIGSPHLSFAEFEALAALLGGRRLAVPFYACTGRHVVRALEAAGRRTTLEASGITIVADTCVVVTPILAEIAGVLMTNSGKFAHYAPGNTGYSVQFGSLEDCVESGVAGKLVREAALWS